MSDLASEPRSDTEYENLAKLGGDDDSDEAGKGDDVGFSGAAEQVDGEEQKVSKEDERGSYDEDANEISEGLAKTSISGDQGGGDDKVMETSHDVAGSAVTANGGGDAKRGDEESGNGGGAGTATQMGNDNAKDEKSKLDYTNYVFDFGSLKKLIDNIRHQNVQDEREIAIVEAKKCWDLMYETARTTHFSNLKCPKCHKDPSSSREANPHLLTSEYEHVASRLLDLASKQSPESLSKHDMDRARLDFLALEEIYLQGGNHATCDGLAELRDNIDGIRLSFKERNCHLTETLNTGPIDPWYSVYVQYDFTMEKLQPLIDYMKRRSRHFMQKKVQYMLDKTWEMMLSNAEENWKANMLCPECGTVGDESHETNGFNITVYRVRLQHSHSLTSMSQDKLDKIKKGFEEEEIKYVDANFDPARDKCRGLAFMKQQITLLQLGHKVAFD